MGVFKCFSICDLFFSSWKKKSWVTSIPKMQVFFFFFSFIVINKLQEEEKKTEIKVMNCKQLRGRAEGVINLDKF